MSSISSEHELHQHRHSLSVSGSTPSTSSPFDNLSSPANSTMATSMSSASSQQGEDVKLIHCRWETCTKTYGDPEDLYYHLCNDHVGRKSTNNLCLSCKWEGCDVTCAKRDHITSHLRVHTPLKPHACDACGKLFKRPQDLKKHERIHTEQHHQARQLKYQTGPSNFHPYGTPQHGMAPYGVDAGVAGWNTERGASGGQYYQSASFSHPGQSNASSGMYPSLTGGASGFRHVSPSMAASNAAAAAAAAAAAVVYGADASSVNSLSPLSSHLGTPAAGSSPAAHAYYSANHGTSAGYRAMQSDRPKPNENDDPNSYSYLAQGSSSLAGSKRTHEATATFFDDVRRKRVAPTYDQAMAERLEQSFAHGIDDATLYAIFSSLDGGAPSSTATSTSTPTTAMPTTEAASKLSLPEALKQTDLAELNAFLLQVGANASRDDSHHSVSSASSSSSNSSSFDFQAALAASGLTNIAGFDENLLQMAAATANGSAPPDYNQHGHNANQSWSYGAGNASRPIAQLPQRYHYQGGSGNVPSYNQPQASNMSFDSMRASRGHAYVPQLGARDMVNPTYRHVEALTRAAPDVRRTTSFSSEPRTKDTASVTAADSDDAEMDEGDDDARSPSPVSTPSVASSSHSASSAFNLYPRMTIGDPARRLPSLISAERTGSGSIASILSKNVTSSQDTAQWRERQGRATNRSSSSSPSPPPQSPPASHSSLYPTISPSRKSPLPTHSMDGIARDVAAMGVAADAAESEAGAVERREVPANLRRNHARLIVDLLIALNRPIQRRSSTPEASYTRLAPLRSRDVEETMDRAATPTMGRRSTATSSGVEEDETNSDDTADARQPVLPHIRDLLNDVDTRRAPKELVGAGGRRIMDVDG